MRSRLLQIFLTYELCWPHKTEQQQSAAGMYVHCTLYKVLVLLIGTVIIQKHSVPMPLPPPVVGVFKTGGGSGMSDCTEPQLQCAPSAQLFMTNHYHTRENTSQMPLSRFVWGICSLAQKTWIRRHPQNTIGTPNNTDHHVQKT